AVHIQDLLAVDTFIPRAVQGGIAGECSMENAVGIAAMVKSDRYGNIDVLQAACRQEVWINPLDAQKRGIANGDKVRVFNDRGEV
ncbi:hypothetical protein MJM95_31515, partial [Salmonella enterica subsp. enterica serovar Anatum]|nr:hypothetical protein [Salmonella enterica subsp. enterica serovar Anatum]